MSSTRAETAVEAFRTGMLCSQAVLSSYGPDYGLDKEMAVKIARGFGSGISRMSETCGAVSAAIMVLGLPYEGIEKQAKEETYRLVQEFMKEFKARHSSFNCTCLLGCHLGTAEGQEHFNSRGLKETHCITFIRDVGDILEKLLDGSKNKVTR